MGFPQLHGHFSRLADFSQSLYLSCPPPSSAMSVSPAWPHRVRTGLLCYFHFPLHAGWSHSAPSVWDQSIVGNNPSCSTQLSWEQWWFLVQNVSILCFCGSQHSAHPSASCGSASLVGNHQIALSTHWCFQKPFFLLRPFYFNNHSSSLPDRAKTASLIHVVWGQEDQLGSGSCTAAKLTRNISLVGTGGYQELTWLQGKKSGVWALQPSVLLSAVSRWTQACHPLHERLFYFCLLEGSHLLQLICTSPQKSNSFKKTEQGKLMAYFLRRPGFQSLGLPVELTELYTSK